jgi:hypothetical protein
MNMGDELSGSTQVGEVIFQLSYYKRLNDHVPLNLRRTQLSWRVIASCLAKTTH